MGEEAGAAVARGIPKDVPGLLRAAVASQPGGLLQRLAQEGLRQHGQVYPDHQGRVRAPVQAAPWEPLRTSVRTKGLWSCEPARAHRECQCRCHWQAPRLFLKSSVFTACVALIFPK